MDTEEPKSLPQAVDRLLNKFSIGIVDYAGDFEQVIHDAFDVLRQDTNFDLLTAEVYARERSNFVRRFDELSKIQSKVTDIINDLIEDVRRHCTALTQNPHLESSESASPQDTQTLARRFSTATGYDLPLKPHGGGFSLSESRSPVNDDDKDPKALLEKISNLEEEVVSLKNENESLTVENGKLKIENAQLMPQHYMTELEQWRMEQYMTELEQKKMKQNHESKMNEMNLKMKQYLTEIAHLKAAHNQKEFLQVFANKKISNLEEKVESLKQKNKSLTVENGELKIEDNKKSQEIANRVSEMNKMNLGMQQYMTEIAQLKAADDEKEIFKGVTNKKISNLEEEVESLKQKNESLTVENGELKTQREEEIEDINLYMSKSIQEYNELKDVYNELKDVYNESQKAVGKYHEHMTECLSNMDNYQSLVTELHKGLKQKRTELEELRATHEKKEKIWKQNSTDIEALRAKHEKREEVWKNLLSTLQQQVKEKTASIDQQSEHMRMRVLPSFDNVQKLIDELKLKVVEPQSVQKLADELKLKAGELQCEVEKQTKAMSNKE